MAPLSTPGNTCPLVPTPKLILCLWSPVAMERTMLAARVKGGPSKVEVDSIMASVMQSQPGLSLEKFLNVMSTKKAARFYHNEVRQLFTAFDRQCKGFLSFEDFKKAFNIVAPKLPERIIIEAFSPRTTVSKNQAFILTGRGKHSHVTSPSLAYGWTRLVYSLA
ncbi:EF-hand calcium-binding domain-containing protein 11 isoform X4 [Varanus komodoensis]|uniref:EF-hand calcium-binding domain-containing protein 11 isoform X4 n=1 Tax=Varanus komodoensis TaxID=61221 RepID=UPI001CF7AB99|nr:EF-hand calcium-binding domain-containing protein 11 isoform X4 [Varanus komodoensis]